MCTWNVNGIHTPIKRRKVLAFLKKEGVQIALLQETHLNDQEHAKLSQGGFGQVFFSSFTSRSRGVVILVKRGMPFQLVEVVKDTRGRYLIVKGVLYGEEIAFLNIYWPPGHPGDFLTTEFAKLAERGVKTLFIGGDFNCHLCPIIDKFPTGKSLLSTQAKTVRALCEDFDYVDIWRTCHPAEQEYTFFL